MTTEYLVLPKSQRNLIELQISKELGKEPLNEFVVTWLVFILLYFFAKLSGQELFRTKSDDFDPQSVFAVAIVTCITFFGWRYYRNNYFKKWSELREKLTREAVVNNEKGD